MRPLLAQENMMKKENLTKVFFVLLAIALILTPVFAGVRVGPIILGKIIYRNDSGDLIFSLDLLNVSNQYSIRLSSLNKPLSEKIIECARVTGEFWVNPDSFVLSSSEYTEIIIDETIIIVEDIQLMRTPLIGYFLTAREGASHEAFDSLPMYDDDGDLYWFAPQYQYWEVSGETLILDVKVRDDIIISCH